MEVWIYIDGAPSLEDHRTPTGAIKIQNVIYSVNKRYGIIVKKAVVYVGVNLPSSLKRRHIETQSFGTLSRTIIVVSV